MAYDTIQALGATIAQQAEIYIWPSDMRPADDSGNKGVLHAKCAVADRRLLFVSSANLTERALSLNIELGLLIESNMQASSVAEQFDALIAQGILERIRQAN